MRNFKKVILTVTSAALIVFGSFSAFAAATGTSTVQQSNYIAEKLISNAKLKFSSTDKYSFDQIVKSNLTSTVASENNVDDISTSHFEFDGNKSHSVTMSNSNGTNKITEIYYVKDGNTLHEYTITDGIISKNDTDYNTISDPRYQAFPIVYHGNETVTMTDTEYVVTGFLTGTDMTGSMITSTGSFEDELAANLLSTIINPNALMPYECRFDIATGNLKSMYINMTSLIEGLYSLFGFTAQDAGITSMELSTFMSDINYDDNTSIVVPASVLAVQ